MPTRNLDLEDLKEAEMLLRPFDVFIVGVDPGVTTCLLYTSDAADE